jgi:hypothetical protein
MWYIIHSKTHTILYASRRSDKVGRKCERFEREGFKESYTEWKDDDR